MPSDDESTNEYEAQELEQSFTERERIQEQLNEKYPNRPTNSQKTLPFHVLYQDLFGPLTANLKSKTKGRPSGRQAGPHGPSSNPKEVRKGIIGRFIARWRREVGDDIFPAMRLIIPEKDRERAMYGLKEKALAVYLVKLMKIDKNSEDGFSLLNWKLPGQNAAARNAGDFPGRCYEVLSKRAYLIDPGKMTIEEVNRQLDLLSKRGQEETQLPIMETFYKNMNADEMTWLIRIITRNMKIGATERTILSVWHPDAEALFNVSSSLRRVCWELHDPGVRLENEDRSVTLGECYQPQLALQPNTSFKDMVAIMKPTEQDPEFWIEEKLDGERMQLHIMPDAHKPSGRKFVFLSRHAKNYSYLYGDGSATDPSALTQYIGDGFKDGVENAVLDGEMITWNMKQDIMVPFGTLKTAAKQAQNSRDSESQPFYRVFDILMLNGQNLMRYTLRDRRKALDATINDVHRRMEILPYSIGTCADDIERSLRDVVARASEGLVVKNPRAAYILNARLNDWIKVKPEYMTEFGESLDCLIIGGYYGTGHRGGELSSFLCGLREDGPKGKKNRKFLSLFKVGGGMTTDDFAKLRHNTEGKWVKYDPSRPPTEYIVLGGGQKQIERPDMWIKPEDSIVVEVKAASVNPSEDYAVSVTLRFPRFTRFRLDKNWETALSVEDFQNVRVQAEIKAEENKKEAKKMRMDKRKQKTQATSKKKQIIVAGYEGQPQLEPGYDRDSLKGKVFRGLTFYIMTESTKPEKKSKAELEQMVKEHGGAIVQSTELKSMKDSTEYQGEVICVAERRTVKVASLEKRGKKEIIRPVWLFDCVKQAKIDFAKGLTEIVVPLELERHLFFATEEKVAAFEGHIDRFGDSFARDTTEAELKDLVEAMDEAEVDYAGIDKGDLMDPGNCRGWMFTGLVIWFDDEDLNKNGHQSSEDQESKLIAAAKITARFSGAQVVVDFHDLNISHMVLTESSNKQQIRKEVAKRERLPRIVSLEWIEECWKEHTRIDEERFAIV